MFIHVVLVTTFFAFMSASYATPTDSPLSPFDSLHLVFRARTPPFGVNLRRQEPLNNVSLSDFPVQCQQGCTPLVNAINTCPTTTPIQTCVCNPTVDSSLASCFSCSVSADPTATEAAQQAVDAYNTACSGTGVSSISYTATGTSASATASIPKTGTSTTTSATGTASGKSSNAPVIRPRAALTSIGLAMALSIVIL